MRRRIIVLSCVLACAVAAGAAGTIVVAETDDATAVEALVDEPAHLETLCFVPTRTELAVRRDACDALAEASAFQHGVLRPENPNDPMVAVKCPFVEDGARPAERYVCLGVGQP